MARKKVNSQSKDNNKQPPAAHDKPQTLIRQPSLVMEEDTDEKFQNLKSLNHMLLKQTVEKRLEVESLEKSKLALEAELTRLGDRESEVKFGLKFENDLFLVFIENLVNEMSYEMDSLVREKSDREGEVRYLKDEVSRVMSDLSSESERLSVVNRENASLRNDLVFKTNELNRFKERVVDLEENEMNIKDEMMKVKMECQVLVQEMCHMETDFKTFRRENENFEKTVKENELLSKTIEGLVGQNKDIEEEWTRQIGITIELEKEIEKLTAILREMEKKDEEMNSKVLGLEKSFGEAMNKKKEMEEEIEALVADKEVKERLVLILTEDKDTNARCLKRAELEIDDLRKHKIAKLVQERSDMQEMIVAKEDKLIELGEEVNELRETGFNLQESCRNQEEKREELESAIRKHTSTNGQLKSEIDELRKNLFEETKKVVHWKSTAEKLEAKIKTTLADFECLRKVNSDLTEQNNMMETQFRSVSVEKDLAQKSLVEARQSVADLSVQVEELGKKVVGSESNVAELVAKQKVIEKLMKQVESQLDLAQKNLVEAREEVTDISAKSEELGLNYGNALKLLKNTTAILCPEKDGKEVAGIESYAADLLEAIENAYRNKEKVIENLTKQLESTQKSLVDANKRKSIWTAISSATAIIAAASAAYAAKRH